MNRINGYDIEVTKGDSLTLRLTFTGRDIPAGTEGQFTVKKRPRDTEALVEKAVTVGTDGNVTLLLTPEDTSLSAGTYFWDMRVMVPGTEGMPSEVITPMEYAAFQVLDAIGDGFEITVEA